MEASTRATLFTVSKGIYMGHKGGHHEECIACTVAKRYSQAAVMLNSEKSSS